MDSKSEADKYCSLFACSETAASMVPSRLCAYEKQPGEIMENSMQIITHRIHGAGIYANIGGILMGSMLPYIAYMDPMGLFGTVISYHTSP